jgi:hypothetical protein
MFTGMAFYARRLAKRFGAKLVSVAAFTSMIIGCILFGPMTFIDNALVKSTGCASPDKPKKCPDYLLGRQIFAVIGLLFLGTATGAAAVTMMVELIQTVN